MLRWRAFLPIAGSLLLFLPPAPSDDSPARRDRYGDPLPAGAVARLGTTRFRSGTAPANAAFSPNGKLLAVAERDAGLRKENVALWDVVNGLVRQSFTDFEDMVTAMVFAPDGKTLATGTTAGTLLLWDVSGR